MKPLAEILRQLGLDTTSHPMETAALHEDHTSVETAPIRIPPGLMDLIKARVQANHAFAHVEWPQRGQILRLEKIKPTFDERPFLVLLSERTTTPNVWAGYVVAPESELDYSANGDIPLDELIAVRDPMAGFVQLWNPVRIPVPSATSCLAWLGRDALDSIVQAINRLQAGADERIDQQSVIPTYRQSYRQAAAAWSARADRLELTAPDKKGFIDRIKEQLSAVSQIALIGQWQSAIEHAMGAEEDHPLIWCVSDLEINFDTNSLRVRKIDDSPGVTRIDLLLNDLLLESHVIERDGDTARISLPEQRSHGTLHLAIYQPGRLGLELSL